MQCAVERCCCPTTDLKIQVQMNLLPTHLHPHTQPSSNGCIVVHRIGPTMQVGTTLICVQRRWSCPDHPNERRCRHSPKCPAQSASFCPQVSHAAFLLLIPCAHTEQAAPPEACMTAASCRVTHQRDQGSRVACRISGYPQDRFSCETVVFGRFLGCNDCI